MQVTETQRNICNACCCIFSSCKHICSLCTQELMLNSEQPPLQPLLCLLLYSDTLSQQFFSSTMSASQILVSVPLAPWGVLHPSHQSPRGCRRLRHRSRALHPCTIFWPDFSLRKGFLLGNRKRTKLVSFLILSRKPLLEMRTAKHYFSLALFCLAILPSTSGWDNWVPVRACQ